MSNTDTKTDETYEYTIMIEARVGSVRAARGLVGRAIRQALNVKRWNDETASHYVDYTPANYDGPDSEPRYVIEMTNATADRLSEVLETMSRAEGWTGSPASFY